MRKILAITLLFFIIIPITAQENLNKFTIQEFLASSSLSSIASLIFILTSTQFNR